MDFSTVCVSRGSDCGETSWRKRAAWNRESCIVASEHPTLAELADGIDLSLLAWLVAARTADNHQKL